MINLFDAGVALPALGSEIGVSNWISIQQERITAFGRITDDPDLMHIDPDWAATHSPYGKTLAFGFLTMSMLTWMLNDAFVRPKDEVSSLNYGFDRLRLLSPVFPGSRLRGRFVLKDLALRTPTQYRVKYGVTVEIEGEPKAALIADWLAVVNVGVPRDALVFAR